MGSMMLTHLHSGWHVDQAIVSNRYTPPSYDSGVDLKMLIREKLSEEKKVIVMRFGRDSDPAVMAMDEHLYKISDMVKEFATIFVCDHTVVKDFNYMYELVDECTVMFFWRNKHILVDLGTGNNNKLNFPLSDKQELIDIIEVVYRAASKGKGLAVSPRDYAYSRKY